LITVVLMGLAAVWCYGHSAWIATLAGLITVAAFVGRRYVVILSILAAIFTFSAFKISPEFHEHVVNIFSDPDMNANDRRDLWHANLKMFEDNPWIGVGLGRNEFRLPEFYEKIKISKSTVGQPIIAQSHNTYFQLLATSGFLGFACYMIFILLSLLMTLRLWNEVPQTHFWHRVFVLGSLATQVAACSGGLTQWNLGIPEVNHVFIFVLAWTLYIGHRYGKDIIPDDFAL
jgi:O-antigen ligase